VTSFRAEPPAAAPRQASAAPGVWTPGGPPAGTAPSQPDVAEASAPAAERSADAWPRTPDATAADEKPAPPWAAARTGVATHDDDLDDEDDDEPSRRLHPYTWLHVLVLAVVAFVLGFLIMLLVIQTRPGNGGTEAQAAPAFTTTVVAGPA